MFILYLPKIDGVHHKMMSYSPKSDVIGGLHILSTNQSEDFVQNKFALMYTRLIVTHSL